MGSPLVFSGVRNMKNMTARSLILLGALSLSTLGTAMAGVKSYGFTVSVPIQAGDAQLKPGEYKVKVDGTQAVITRSDSSKSFTVQVTVEQNDKKFDSTVVRGVDKGGVNTIGEIDLGGSTTKLVFTK